MTSDLISDLIQTEKHKAVRLGLCAVLCVLVLYLFMIITGRNGLLDLNRKRARLKSLMEKNQRLEQKNVELYRVINRMKNDPSYIEDLARRELKMIGKDEVIYKFKAETGQEKHNINNGGDKKNAGRKKDRAEKKKPGT